MNNISHGMDWKLCMVLGIRTPDNIK